MKYLSGEQMAKAHLLWSQKKWDTLMIAKHLHVPEHVVWRSLAERRDQAARMREIAKKLAGKP